jgi:SAM-dependent methyltransferase
MSAARRRPITEAPEAARLGNPSFVWRSGQQRRLAIIERYVPLAGRRVLDLGCGLGEYVRAFAREGARACGLDIARSRLVEGRRRGADGLLQAVGEALPFADASLDVVVLNEVIEHVADDRATMREVARVLVTGGVAVVYAPNRLYPFETHGIYLGKRYIFGNIPFVNWLPNILRNRLVPHARAYTARGIESVAGASGMTVIDHGYVYPGFDNIEARLPLLARLLRAACYRAEDSATLRRFGLSHLLVLRREARANEGAAA